jgi:hypothetical protein
MMEARLPLTEASMLGVEVVGLSLVTLGFAVLQFAWLVISHSHW